MSPAQGRRRRSKAPTVLAQNLTSNTTSLRTVMVISLQNPSPILPVSTPRRSFPASSRLPNPRRLPKAEQEPHTRGSLCPVPKTPVPVLQFEKGGKAVEVTLSPCSVFSPTVGLLLTLQEMRYSLLRHHAPQSHPPLSFSRCESSLTQQEFGPSDSNS